MDVNVVKTLREWEGDGTSITRIRTVRMFPPLQPIVVAPSLAGALEAKVSEAICEANKQ